MDRIEELKQEAVNAIYEAIKTGQQLEKDKYNTLLAKHEKAEKALREIDDWAKAYPVKIFPEPTKEYLKQADIILKANGLNLDRISASNIRQVLNDIKDKVKTALKE